MSLNVEGFTSASYSLLHTDTVFGEVTGEKDSSLGGIIMFDPLSSFIGDIEEVGFAELEPLTVYDY